MKNVLLIAYYYPPLGGIGSQRSQKFARYLGEYGWRPIVVTPERGSYHLDPSLDDLTASNVEVIRTRTLDLSSMFKSMIPGARSSAKALGGNNGAGGNAILRTLKRAVNTWVYIPDGQIGWYPYAVRAGRRALESGEVSAIWSTSFPVTAHLVAHKLKLATNKPWIADFRDLWTLNHYADYSSGMRKRIDQVVESTLLDEMDIIVTVSEVWADELRRLTGGRKRVEVIRNAFDSSEFEGVRRTEINKWVITYVGLFYGAKQDPTPFLTALRRAITGGRIAREDVQFNIVGEPDPFVQELVARFDLGDVTNFSGFISHAETIAHQVNSSLLLLIVHGDRTNPGHVPGKLYEYLGSRKPILGILPPHFEAARIIQDAGAGTVIDGSDTEAIEQYLLNSYAAFKSGADLYAGAGDLSAYERRAGARQLAGLLNDATATPFSAIPKETREFHGQAGALRLVQRNARSAPPYPGTEATKRVLLLAYYYPPLGGIGSQRSQKFARYLGEYGWRSIVVAPERGSYYLDPSLDDLTSSNVRVVRTNTLDLSAMFKGLIPGRLSAMEPFADNNGGVNSILKILKRAVNTWVYIPDGQIGWYPYALRAGRRAMASEDVSAIWSTSFPMTAHLVARKLKLETGKPWVADFRDLWTGNQAPAYSSALRKRLDGFIESKLLKDADALVTVSEELAEKLRKLTDGATRVEVIRNGFDSSDFEGIEHTPLDKWTVTFVGSVYRFSDLSPFLMALQRQIKVDAIAREDVRINIVGESTRNLSDLLARFDLEKEAHFTGFVSHRESLKHQVNSSLLLFPLHGDGASPGILSGKLFEYLGARRPILGILHSNFEAAGIIRDAKAGVAVEPSNVQAIEQYLLNSYAAFKSGTDLYSGADDLSAYERISGARQLADLLDDVAGVGSST